MDSSEAKLAYKDLAYTRFKHLPLYLEWAPFKTFSKDLSDNTTKEDTSQG